VFYLYLWVGVTVDMTRDRTDWRKRTRLNACR